MQGPPDEFTERRRRERNERSGNFSADNRFDPDELFEVIASAPNADHADQAMRAFMAHGNPDELRSAIALYTRSARASGKSVENILAELNGMTDRQQGRYDHSGELLAPSQLKRLVLDTVLRGFGDGEPPLKS
jgi:acetyl esterase/lipase